MAEYRVAQNDLVGNAVDKRFTIPKGDYVLTEADGTISTCKEDTLQENLNRIDADIVVRDAEIARLAEEKRLADEAAALEVEQNIIDESTAEDLLLDEMGV